MAGMYSIKDLLALIDSEGAQELRLAPGSQPIMLLHGRPRPLAVSPLTGDNVAELLRSFAPPEQLKELHACGDTHFIYQSETTAKFSINAAMKGEEITVQIRNLRL